MKILVVEDDAAVRKFLITVLKRERARRRIYKKAGRKIQHIPGHRLFGLRHLTKRDELDKDIGHCLPLAHAPTVL